MTKKRTPAKPKRTAVARAVPSPDTQARHDYGLSMDVSAAFPQVEPGGSFGTSMQIQILPATVFVVMGHRGGSHGVIGLYATRERAIQETDALIAKGNKHSREYTFTIDERHIQP